MVANHRSAPRRFRIDAVIAELSHPRYPHTAIALGFIQGVPILAISPEMTALAKVFVDRRVMPKGLTGDALHVAMAVVAEADFLLTWNVKHLAKSA